MPIVADDTIQQAEDHLINIGMGLRSGNVVALLAFLNAHHPAYGRAPEGRMAKPSPTPGQPVVPGDCVRLNSGGPRMYVCDIVVGPGVPIRCKCLWEDENAVDGSRCSWFAHHCLTKVDSKPIRSGVIGQGG